MSDQGLLVVGVHFIHCERVRSEIKPITNTDHACKNTTVEDKSVVYSTRDVFELHDARDVVILFRLRLHVIQSINYRSHLSGEGHPWSMVVIYPLMREVLMDDDHSASEILAHFNVGLCLLWVVSDADIDVTVVEQCLVLDQAAASLVALEEDLVEAVLQNSLFGSVLSQRDVQGVATVLLGVDLLLASVEQVSLESLWNLLLLCRLDQIDQVLLDFRFSSFPEN